MEYKYNSGNFVIQWILLSSFQTYSNILVRAARSGSLEIIIYCLKKGADLHYNDDHALQEACAFGHLHIVKYLIDEGSNLHSYDNALFVGRVPKAIWTLSNIWLIKEPKLTMCP